MGILPRTADIDAIRDKRGRYAALSQAAQQAMNTWVQEVTV
jgi:methylenetetrahydrofolate--tRNA-(uracil-5-)-methyltransferase